MGCTAAKQIQIEDETKATKWSAYFTSDDALEKFSNDGSLPTRCDKSMLELRVFLDDEDLTKAIAQYAASNNIKFKELYACWSDIMEYKQINRECVELQHARACEIMKKHLRGLECDDPRCQEEYSSINSLLHPTFKSSDKETTALEAPPENLFDFFLRKDLEKIHSKIFVAFKKSPLYTKTVNELKKSHVVNPDDFDYIKKLGQGANGFVVQVRKKSTGIHYAMKVQSKVRLLKTFGKAPHRVLDERNALVKCVHPFIIGMEYALDNSTMVMMVSELGTVGTLHERRNRCANGKMPLDRVIFYSAEIILALGHIHRLGLIYRDLKPGNIVLCSNGHIKLIDLGGVIDPRGNLSVKNPGLKRGLSTTRSFFATTRRSVQFPSESGSVNAAMSFVGTKGYMAPEMRRDADGRFTKAVDWWSLGVTMFELLYNRKPFLCEVFDDEGFALTEGREGGGDDRYVPDMKGKSNKASFSFMPEPSKHQSTIIPQNFLNAFLSQNKYSPSDYVIYFKQDDGTVAGPLTKDLLGRLLIVDARKRLGSGKDGILNIKNHAFYDGINWDKLEQVQLTPPVVVPNAYSKSTRIPPLYGSFEEMTKSLCRDNDFKEKPSDGEHYFSRWDYVSRSAVKAEVYGQLPVFDEEAVDGGSWKDHE